MALDYRKGFVHTLEAILASTLVLGVVLTVMPEFQQDANKQPQEQVRSGLETLDNTGKLTNDLSPSEIESKIEPYVPAAYNHSVSIVEVESESGKVSSPEEHYIDTSGSYSELQLWIESSNGLNVSFDGEKILEDYSSDGYETVSVSSSSGWLNFTGSGGLEYRFDSYSSDTNDLDQSEVSVTNYILMENGTKEIQVRLWK